MIDGRLWQDPLSAGQIHGDSVDHASTLTDLLSDEGGRVWVSSTRGLAAHHSTDNWQTLATNIASDHAFGSLRPRARGGFWALHWSRAEVSSAHSLAVVEGTDGWDSRCNTPKGAEVGPTGEWVAPQGTAISKGSCLRVPSTLELPAAVQNARYSQFRVDGNGRVWVFGEAGLYVHDDLLAWRTLTTHPVWALDFMAGGLTGPPSSSAIERELDTLPPPPQPNLVGGAAVSVGSVQSRMSSGFRRCFHAGLTIDPTIAGDLWISVRIGPKGEVLSASSELSRGSLTRAVADCCAREVMKHTFAPPDASGASLIIPVSFIP